MSIEDLVLRFLLLYIAAPMGGAAMVGLVHWTEYRRGAIWEPVLLGFGVGSVATGVATGVMLWEAFDDARRPLGMGKDAFQVALPVTLALVAAAVTWMLCGRLRNDGRQG